MKIGGPVVIAIDHWLTHTLDIATQESGGSAQSRLVVVDDAHIADLITNALGQLESHATAPPLLFYRKYIDPWTVFPSAYIAEWFDDAAKVLRVNYQEKDWLFVRQYDLPKLVARLNDSIASMQRDTFQIQEYLYLMTMIRDCLESWKELIRLSMIDTTIIFSIESVGGSWLDDDIVRSCTYLPSWFAASFDR